jgi:hypothetical protein
MKNADLILYNGRIATLDPKQPHASNLAIKDGRIVGVDDAEEYQRGPAPRRSTSRTHRHSRSQRLAPAPHPRRLNYNLELRWDGVPSLAMRLRMLKLQAERTPAPQWVRVVGSWSEVPICRAPHADAGGSQRRRAGDAGIHPAPLLPRAAQSRRAARLRLHARHAESARRRNSARQKWRARPAC